MPTDGLWWKDGRPRTVGSLGALEDVPHILQAGLDADLLELRLDLLKFLGVTPSQTVAKLAHTPLLLTARCPSEGGHSALSEEVRFGLLEESLEHARAIDIELSNFASAENLIARARSQSICTIASFHDFEKTPTLSTYREHLAKAADLGADVFKCAARLHSLSDLQTLVDLFQDSPLPISAMGMGDLGPASRVILAQSGSLLNYGFVGEKPTAPGQWPARLLKEAIHFSIAT